MKKNSIAANESSKAAGKKVRHLTIGMDLGDKTSRYCVLGEGGAILREGSVGTTRKALAQVFGVLARCRIAIEVGTHSPWISRLLKSFGHEVIVANARQVKLIS